MRLLKPSYHAVTWFVVAAVIASVATVLMPLLHLSSEAAVLITLWSSVFIAVIQAGAMWLFFDGLASFRAKLRLAYILLMAGFMLAALAGLQISVATIGNLWNTAWVEQGWILLPYLIATIGIYAGPHVFARILGLRTFWASWWFMLLMSATASAVASQLPYMFTHQATADLTAYSVLFGWFTISNGLALLIIMRIKSMLSEAYAKAMTWLAFGIGAYMFTSIEELVSRHLVSADHWFFGYNLDAVPLVATAILLLFAGQAFVRIVRIEPGGLAGPHDSRLASAASDVNLLDAVMRLARLASQPAAIEQAMDPVRMVTARYAGVASPVFTSQDEAVLIQVYGQLEKYLTTREPMRIYTVQQLRDSVPPKLRHQLPPIQ